MLQTGIRIPRCYDDVTMAVLTPELEVRFWAQVRKQDGEGCWEWQGGRATKLQYGYMSLGHSSAYAHRISWQIAHGSIQTGLCVLHRCDNPPCVRPDHLFLGTRRDNMTDKIEKGRQHRGEQTGGVVLAEAQVMDILAAYATGEFPILGLADKHGVKEATIRAIVNGQTWAHVAGPRLSRAEIVALGKKHRVAARIEAKRAAGWPPGACSVCGERGHYKPRCPRKAA